MNWAICCPIAFSQITLAMCSGPLLPNFVQLVLSMLCTSHLMIKLATLSWVPGCTMGLRWAKAIKYSANNITKLYVITTVHTNTAYSTLVRPGPSPLRRVWFSACHGLYCVACHVCWWCFNLCSHPCLAPHKLLDWYEVSAV